MAGTLCALSTTNELERINSKGIKHFALNTKKIDTHLIQSRNKGTGHLSFNPLFHCTLGKYKVFAVVIEFDDYVQSEERRITHWAS